MSAGNSQHAKQGTAPALTEPYPCNINRETRHPTPSAYDTRTTLMVVYSFHTRIETSPIATFGCAASTTFCDLSVRGVLRDKAHTVVQVGSSDSFQCRLVMVCRCLPRGGPVRGQDAAFFPTTEQAHPTWLSRALHTSATQQHLSGYVYKYQSYLYGTPATNVKPENSRRQYMRTWAGAIS